MSISGFEHRILKTIYEYWNDSESLAKKIMKANPTFSIDAYEIHEQFGRSGFSQSELSLLCIRLKVYALTGNQKKDKKSDTRFLRSIDRLYADEYILNMNGNVQLSNKGTLAALDRVFIETVVRENKTWLLSLIISLFALVFSILGMVIKSK